MTKQVSPYQLELLLDFLGQHHHLALGRVRGKEGNVMSNRLWLQCSKILNSDHEGAQKSPDKWKKVSATYEYNFVTIYRIKYLLNLFQKFPPNWLTHWW